MEKNALFSLDQIQLDPLRQGLVILRSGFGSNLPPSLKTALLLPVCFSSLLSLWVGSCQSRFDLSSCTNWQTFLTIGISEPYMR